MSADYEPRVCFFGREVAILLAEHAYSRPTGDPIKTTLTLLLERWGKGPAVDFGPEKPAPAWAPTNGKLSAAGYVEMVDGIRTEGSTVGEMFALRVSG